MCVKLLEVVEEGLLVVLDEAREPPPRARARATTDLADRDPRHRQRCYHRNDALTHTHRHLHSRAACTQAWETCASVQPVSTKQLALNEN